MQERKSEKEIRKTFDKVIGYTREKKELLQIADTIVNRDAYNALGVRPPCGLLMDGMPGVGKTLMAKCLIEAVGLPVFICRKDQPNGRFVEVIKSTFKEAAEQAPSIVFLDDMDKFANADYNHRDAEEYVTVQACIDEYKEKDIFVLATTNDINKLPGSLTRAGRFDRVMHIGAPVVRDAVKIIEHYLSSKKAVSQVDTELLARIMNGRSCAYLETVINEAGILAGRERESEIKMEHIIQACIKTVFRSNINEDYDDDDYDYDYGGGQKDKENISNMDEVAFRKKLVCHEIGHTVVSEILYPGSTTIVAIADSGTGSRGFASSYCENEQDIDWIKGRLVSGLGGMAATEQRLGIEDIGNSEDLKKVFQGVRELVAGNCTYGFDYKSFGYSTSETRKTKIEEMCGGVVSKYYRKAKEIIVKNREFFDKLEDALFEKGVLVSKDIEAIRKTCEIVPVVVD